MHVRQRLRPLGKRQDANLEHRGDSVASDKAVVDTFLDRTPHSDGPEVVKIEMADEPTRVRVVGWRD